MPGEKKYSLNLPATGFLLLNLAYQPLHSVLWMAMICTYDVYLLVFFLGFVFYQKISTSIQVVPVSTLLKDPTF